MTSERTVCTVRVSRVRRTNIVSTNIVSAESSVVSVAQNVELKCRDDICNNMSNVGEHDISSDVYILICMRH